MLRGPLVILCACLINSSLQRSTPEDDHYVAAVVEYAVNSDVEYNRLKYMELIGDAAQQNVDIVVFPELTLTNAKVSISLPIHGLLKEHPIPALRPDLYDELLVSMSAAARQHEIYVMFNGREIVDCRQNNTGEECPEAKEYVFNSNVVLDRTGAVIDRYRKINLFGEYTHTSALHPNLGLFRTDFGVTFGHFICFDLMFQVPAAQVVQKHQVTDIVFSTMWFSNMPFVTAVQIQQAYAFALNVNFIAAGANKPEVGVGGSGIYSGKAGALVSIMPGVSTTRLLVAKVPKVPGKVTEPIAGPIFDDPSVPDGLFINCDPSQLPQVTRLLEDGAQEFVLFDKDVSCTFRAKLSHGDRAENARYRAMVHDGSFTIVKRQASMASCAVVACKDDNILSCNYKFDPNTPNSRFEELEIEMRTYSRQYNQTLKCDNVVYFPASLQANKFPLSPKNATFIDKGPDGKIFNHQDKMNLHNEIEQNAGTKTQNGKQDGHEYVTYKINEPQDGLVVFGIFGRTYTKDINHNTATTAEDLMQFNILLDIIYG